MSKRINKELKLENKVIDTIKKYNLIENGDKIVIGVSGGPDSMCLLDNLVRIRRNFQLGLELRTEEKLMTKLKSSQSASEAKGCLQPNPEPVGMSPIKPGTDGDFEIVVAHVNHMIREEAQEEEEYVEQYCKKNKIEFYSKSIDVQKLAHTNKIGTEEAGRIARYEFFDEVLEKTNANKIAIAHNKNDKIETILMHVLRGCGIEGLKGIEVKKEKLIRPLIDCERIEIEKYCLEQKLNPRIDKTNFDNIYTRNKIRNIVIPYIQEEFNPNIMKTLNRLSNIIIQEDEYMESITEEIYRKLVIEEKSREIVIELKSFNSQKAVIKSRLIRYIIKRLLGATTSIENIHIEDIIKLCHNNIGNKYLTPNKNIKVLVKNHKIYFQKQGEIFTVSKNK